MAILGFIRDLRPSELKDFWKITEHEIPTSPGVYLLAGIGKTHFHYPMGKSPIYYIGQSKNLRRRLLTHFRYATETRGIREDDLYYPDLYFPRYEYAAVFGGRYSFVRTWKGKTPKKLEEEVMARFAKKHHCFPIANGAGSWWAVKKIMKEE